jgi:arginine:agmatine antiporter
LRAKFRELTQSGQISPQQGGPYAYARDFLGPYAGFQTNYIYWFGNWVGNIAIAVAAVGYLAELVPNIDGPPASTIVTALIIWLLTFANILGPRVVGAGGGQVGADSHRRDPILGWWWFVAVFKGSWNVSGGSDWHAISRAASMVLGLHGHRKRRHVGRRHREPGTQHSARHHHWAGARGVVYMLSSTVIMGIMPAAGCRIPTRPSPRRASPSARRPSSSASRCSNPWVARWVDAAGGPVRQGGGRRRHVSGSSASSTNTAFRSPASSSCPHFDPGCLRPYRRYRRAVQPRGGPAVILIVPYIYSAIALINLLAIQHVSRKVTNTFRVLALSAVFYCLWAVVGGDEGTVVNAFVAMLLSVPLYLFVTRRTQPAILRQPVVSPPAPMENATSAGTARPQR